MKEKIRIAAGQGFWGDLLTAPLDQVTKGPIDYLVMDFLAEVTMSILHKQKNRNPELGYAKDLVSITDEILPICVEKKIKIVTNGGGVNPEGCCEAILRCARKRGIKGLKVGIVLGDDILGRIDEYMMSGITFTNMETGEPFEKVRHKISSANVYFGATPIVQALQLGADIVITGRTTDTALTVGPLVYEFGWSENDWNKLASGTVAGHILECGGQATGGNFSADWRSVPDLAHIGFPIAEVYQNGDIVITKHEGTGGLVNVATVTEQLVYEIGDPKRFLTPDCIVDFTTIQLEQEDTNRVRIRGVRGYPAPDDYKVSMSYSDGYMAIGTLTYAWPDALEKAKKADEILRTRFSDLGLVFDEIHTEFIGYNSSHGPLVPSDVQPQEVLFCIGVRSQDQNAVERFTREIAPLILNGPPGVTGYGAGRPKPREVLAFWPALIPKSAVKPEVVVKEV